MQELSQEIIQIKKYCKIHKNKPFITICRSPFCGYYRELCQQCIINDQDHKDKFHIPINTSYLYVQNRLSDIQKGILILKKQKQEKQKHNLITLPLEVKQKLDNIRLIINDKITLFQKFLQQTYQKQVNMKLQNLSQTLKKSIDFIQKQQKQFSNNFDFLPNLKKFFLNFQYWDHQRKYYKSYMEQILQKQVKIFKQGFDDDNIMKLIVNFQTNLKTIFSQNKQINKNQINQRPHIFFEDKNQLKKYQIIQRFNNQNFLIKPQLLGKPYPKQNYKWTGKPQSIYHPGLQCFFIFGQGKTPSNAILKYEDGKQIGNKKLSFIGQMFTKRSCFSTCLMKGQIFIIGGYNQKEGCMVKCQKMVVNPKIKIYLVSSLQQRSACHTVCNYKNKYILKFGGTNIKSDAKGVYNIQMPIQQLYPQIYDIQKQQWRIINYDSKRLQFGLYPVIVAPYQSTNSKIFVFGNKPLQDEKTINNKKNEFQRKLFEIKCILSRNDIVQMKIYETKYPINKRYHLFPQACHMVQKRNSCKIIGIDKMRNQISLNLIDLDYQS